MERIQEWRYNPTSDMDFVCAHGNTLAFTSGTLTLDAKGLLISSSEFAFLNAQFDVVDLGIKEDNNAEEIKRKRL